MGDLDVSGKPIQFLVDMGATYSVLTSHSGSLTSETCAILEIRGKAHVKISPQSLPCIWRGWLFSDSNFWSYQNTQVHSWDEIPRLPWEPPLASLKPSVPFYTCLGRLHPMPFPQRFETKRTPKCGMMGFLRELTWPLLSKSS